VSVPDVLQGGDHARIARWRRWHQLRLTLARRPDLLDSDGLSAEDRRLLALEEKDL
jgi:tRNA (guanine37-N1)-methyltransferase